MDNYEYNISMEFLTRKEVAKYFRVSERTIDRWVADGRIKAYKLGDGRTSVLRIPKGEIKKFLDKNKSKKNE